MQFDFTDQIKQKTDKELKEIFINAKDYNPDFVRLAEQELNARNINLDEAKQIRKRYLQTDTEELTEEKPGSPLYIFFCFVLTLLGGIVGIYAGYIYSQSKKKHVNGGRYYVYDEQTRQLGRIMIGLGIGVILFLVIRQLWLNGQ